MPKNNSQIFEMPATDLPVAVVTVLGASTAMGKTTAANAVGSFFRSAAVAVHTVRIETGVRRAEFPAGDTIIDLDHAGDATHLVGAEASLFDGAWRKIKTAITGGHVVVIDGGAGGQRLLLDVAGSTGLSGLVAARGARCWVVVVTIPDPESARQAAALVADVKERMPEAGVLLAVNCISPTQRPGVDTPQGRAVTGILEPLRLQKINIPYAGAQGLVAFAKSQRSIHEILRADEQQLVRWSGQGELASLNAQAHLAAWWRSVSDQLSQVWRFDASNR